MRFFCVGLALLVCTTQASAQDIRVGCKPGGGSVTELSAQATLNKFDNIHNVVTSASFSKRFCPKSSPIQWTVLISADRVDTEGRITDAARIGGQILYTVYETPDPEGRRLAKSFSVGLQGLVGFEDYNVVFFDPSGTLAEARGQRVTKVLQALAVYDISNRSGARGFPPPWGAVRAEGRLAYVDKRAPSANLPVRLNEGYVDAAGSVAFEHFVDHGRFGSKIEYRASYERIFTNHTAVKGFGTLRAQWRPQANADLHYPDRFALGLSLAVGRGYRGVNLAFSKVF